MHRNDADEATDISNAAVDTEGSPASKITRTSWTECFEEMACCIAKRSPCHRLQVGCILVKDNHPISCGYNGFLPGAPHESIVIDNHEQSTVHAEQNCIADCARRGVATDGCTAYVTHFPCLGCYKTLISAGVKKIYYLNDYNNNPIVYAINSKLDVVLERL